MEIRVGTLLAGRWELRELLAGGGMGDVFRARDHDTGDDVAVKVMRAVNPEGARRFADEVRSLESIDHPNVVRLLDAGEHDGVPFLVMELVPGKPLTSLLERRTLTLEEMRRLGTEIASGLAFAHERGIVNRDVTPSNVLFDAEDSAKLADFGIALMVGATRITDAAMTIGSATYLAPEQITDEPIGPPADVYALGLLLIEAWTGEPAFPGPFKDAAMARLSRDPQVPDDLPGPWRRILALMTARDPESRPAAAEVTGLLRSGQWDLTP